MSFFKKIKQFNNMYKMPENGEFNWHERLVDFKSILSEELEEMGSDHLSFATDEEFKVAMADWLGDIIVYSASEAGRWGIPIERVLDVIMESNFSKLGADGNPIYDGRGKLMKGPNYWKPEPKIRKVLAQSQELTLSEVMVKLNSKLIKKIEQG